MQGNQGIRRVLGRGELVRLLYRLGRGSATGVLTLTARLSRGEVFVLRRGRAVVPDIDVARRALVGRLARLAAIVPLDAVFEGGVAGIAPTGAGVDLATWARNHLEAQLDSSRAEQLLGELAGARLSLRPELAPEPTDEADRRMLAALAAPRRLDQIWTLARTPRFRLLAFVHFLRSVDALDATGIAVAPAASDPRRAARRLLGVDERADHETLKRAYRRLARALHPDLQPELDADGRRTLERRFAEVTAAYESLR